MIDLQLFVDIEDRIDDHPDHPATLFLNKRLQYIAEESVPEDCHQELLASDKLNDYIRTQYASNAPFLDIPRLPMLQLDDTELKFWAATIADYRVVATRCPKYLTTMVRSGIPPALRGKTWKSMAEAWSATFESLYDSLAAEWTPFVKIIGRDLNRTFPEIRLFQKKNGKGQNMLGRVLRAYSAYDMQVGYCQGLTFLAGPLLLHMSDKDAFCVLVRLMEDYDLRSMFTADMTGLQLRMYQFESLLRSYLPELNAHFMDLGVNSIYASQWFLSFFAVTCPLSMLVRIYDLVFAEGAIATIMRVALAVLERNQKVLLQFEDEEDVLQHLLGRQLWDVYAFDADLLVTDVSSIHCAALQDLDALEADYRANVESIKRAKSSRKRKSTIKRRANHEHDASISTIDTTVTDATATSADGERDITADDDADVTTTCAEDTTAAPVKQPSSFRTRLFPWGAANARRNSSIVDIESEQLSRSDSKISVHSFESESTLSVTSGHSSSGSSFSSMESEATLGVLKSREADLEAKLIELQSELDATRSALQKSNDALELERKERETDKILVEEMFARMASLKQTDEVADSIDRLKTRFAISDQTIGVVSPSGCKSCERYLMDLAAVKTAEAVARQEIDELRDYLKKEPLLLPQKSPLPPPPSQPQLRHSPSKGWGLWGRARTDPASS
ncbi:hypothetical protein TRVA0_014S01090 [Trichomonascus vanleenenianus]|uniref:TBC domain-containing protein n=1 Tax=Trichomonascus vanleenenianus TaxID=2268995 RepID=UPI003ECB43CE